MTSISGSEVCTLKTNFSLVSSRRLRDVEDRYMEQSYYLRICLNSCISPFNGYLCPISGQHNSPVISFSYLGVRHAIPVSRLTQPQPDLQQTASYWNQSNGSKTPGLPDVLAVQGMIYVQDAVPYANAS